MEETENLTVKMALSWVLSYKWESARGVKELNVLDPEEAACFAIKCSKQNHMDSI